MKKVLHFRTVLRSKSVVSLLTIAWILVCSCSSNPQKRPSPLRTDTTRIAGTDLYIEFSSPAVKKRAIFGTGDGFLVPYDKLWRTGANNATYIKLSGDMFVDSMSLESGSYALFTIPGRDEWTLIFNREWEQWGSYNYKDSLHVIRVKVKPRFADQVQERMLFYFADDSLKFRWEKVRWAVPISSQP
ncbi:MAG: DUF2911 domain-containing protein [Ekhidna sp.]|nr:DUF2911 domain-containing protein [Ekhidna sp.]